MAAKTRTPDHGDGDDYKGDETAKDHDGIKYPEERKSFDELATGGRVMKKVAKDPTGAAEGSGKPEFFAGEKSPTADAAEGDRQAASGGAMKAKRKRKSRAEGGRLEGEEGHKRLDRHHGMRKKRAAGGMVGSDSKPLTEAHKLMPPKGDKRTAQDDPTTDD